MVLSIAEAAAALRSGETTSVALTREALARADRLDAELGVYLHRADADALAAAEAADAALAAGDDRGPLHGIPLAVKDIVATEGWPTTAQSEVLDPAWGTDADAPVVARLRAAGAVLTGKTSTMEFAIGLPDPAKPFPVPRNPWNPERWAGGSSSGTAAGVAAGFFFGGVGTDTGGSIRMPSAVCGVTGIKPTHGLVPAEGVVPLSWTCDHIGPIARSAHDCALLLDVMAGPGTSCAASLDGSVNGLRIGVQRRHLVDAPFVDPVVVSRVDAALDALSAAGAEVTEVDIPAFDILTEACSIIFMSEALAYHRANLRARWQDYGAYTRVMIASAVFYSAADYVQAMRVRRHVRAELAKLFDTFDLIASPTVGAGAPPVAGLDFAGALMLPVFTPVWNALGTPTISVPCGFTDDGLPAGLQLAGRWGEEATVLRAADAYQRRTDWHRRVPPVAEPVASV